MSRYHLTEAYGELYNSRLTEESFYDNLRFVDYLQQEQIEEVMESLIWEFMDYGDTLEEAVDTLDEIFSDEEIISESLEMITEAMSVSQRRTSQRGAMGAHSAQEAQRFQRASGTASRQASSDLESASKLAKSALSGATDSAARARRAERSSAIRGALRSAKGTVGSALSRAKTGIRNNISQLKQVGSDAAQKAKAGLAQVARVGRGIAGGVRGAYRGAKEGAKAAYNAPAPQQQPKMTRSQYELRKNIRAVNVKQAVGQPFSNAGKQAAGQLKSATTAQTNAPRLGLRGLSSRPATQAEPASYPSGTIRRMGVQVTSKAGKALTGAAAAPAIRAARKRSLNASFDYDLLTQYMVEDIIAEGYADTEAEALYVLESMSEENLIDLAECYLAE
jgi:hypothetical protein